jgi:hypothetical protein
VDALFEKRALGHIPAGPDQWGGAQLFAVNQHKGGQQSLRNAPWFDQWLKGLPSQLGPNKAEKTFQEGLATAVWVPEYSKSKEQLPLVCPPLVNRFNWKRVSAASAGEGEVGNSYVYQDTSHEQFSVEQKGNQLTVKRTKDPQGRSFWMQDLKFYCCPQVPDDRQIPPRAKRSKIKKALKKKKKKDTKTKEYRFDWDSGSGITGLAEAFFLGSGMQKQVGKNTKEVKDQAEEVEGECNQECQKSKPDRLLETEAWTMMELADTFDPWDEQEELITLEDWHRDTLKQPKTGPHRLKVQMAPGIHYVATTDATSINHMLERYKDQHGKHHALVEARAALRRYEERPKSDQELLALQQNEQAHQEEEEEEEDARQNKQDADDASTSLVEQIL